MRQYTMGWLKYYAIADMKDFMQQANGWIKRKILVLYLEAVSWILSKTLTDKRIIQMGYDDIFIRYNELHSSY